VTCADVLINYLEGNNEVPWADLRYMFGEVFYGGHITDNMDRRVCNTYLSLLIKPEMLPRENPEGGDKLPPTLEFTPGFVAPNPTNYESLVSYVETALPDESPVMYGMHNNAQLSLLTTQGEILFKTVTEVSGGGSGGGGGGGAEDRIRSAVEDFLATIPESFNMIEIEANIKEETPYTMVAVQEATRMNNLLAEMRQSLEELQLGLDGALNMSERMELLAKGIASNTVPARWMAAMSTRIQEVLPLTMWFHDVTKRVNQLAEWTAGSVETPKVVWLPGLFNPKAFVTAVMQTYARKHKLPLDVMKFMTDVTTKTSPDQITEKPEEGCYIHGLCIEGAGWDKAEGRLVESKPNELRPVMPIIKVRPVHSDDFDLTGYYECPVYVNMQRANVYSPMCGVFTLKTTDDPAKWVSGSVSLLLQDELA
jgi:dynein heavy chain